jgi:hypothetical protein
MVMRVLVSGTRKPSEETRATVRRELYKLHKDSFLHLILGDASGVDAYARAWAESNGVDYTICLPIGVRENRREYSVISECLTKTLIWW